MPKLVVQQGHCYRTSGATGTAGEQSYATQVANACVRLLNRNGWRVNPTLADENDYAGDAFVAVHCDGSVHSTARGASVGYRTPSGQQFGHAWKIAYAARGWPIFRPDNYTAALSGYYGTSEAIEAGNSRAIIIECGFMTNPQDRTLMLGAGGPERVALAIGDALGIHVPQSPKEDDMPAKICKWTGSDAVWAVTPMGHWHLATQSAIDNFATVWDLPKNSAGHGIVNAVAETDWFGPNLTDLVKDAAKAADAVADPPPPSA